MSIINEIKRKIRSAANDGLKKMGIPVYESGAEDDEYDSRDIIDIYRDLYGKGAVSTKVDDIPESWIPELKKSFLPIAGLNPDLTKSLETWIEHRSEMITYQKDNKTVSRPLIQKEGIELCTRLGLMATLSGNNLEAIQKIASAQNRPVRNLLRIASGQCSSDSQEQWIEQMNQKLERFDLCIFRVGENYLTLIDPAYKEDIHIISP